MLRQAQVNVRKKSRNYLYSEVEEEIASTTYATDSRVCPCDVEPQTVLDVSLLGPCDNTPMCSMQTQEIEGTHRLAVAQN
jgi:hypothetical protein